MIKLLQPDLYVRSLCDIPLALLKTRGIKGLIIDLDNTVTEWGRATLDRGVHRWFAELEEQGIRACLVSNNRSSRVKKVADALGIPGISRAGKPRRRAFRQAMAVMDTEAGSTAVIGDQVFTDILGGNRLGLYTVLVMPINSHEFIGTMMMRRVERFFIRHLPVTDFSSHKRS